MKLPLQWPFVMGKGLLIAFLGLWPVTSPLAENKSTADVKPIHINGIKGHDDRVRVDISQYPWRMIGRLNNNGSYCTGILVGPSQVLTAAHCFWDKRRNRWAVPSAAASPQLSERCIW